MRIGRLTIAWDSLPRDPSTRRDALRAEQQQHFLEMAALSRRQFEVFAEALNGELGSNIGLGFRKPDEPGSAARY